MITIKRVVSWILHGVAVVALLVGLWCPAYFYWTIDGRDDLSGGEKFVTALFQSWDVMIPAGAVVCAASLAMKWTEPKASKSA